MSRFELHHGDCLEVMKGMADNSVDAIVTDPPYYRVKKEAWDRQWDTTEGFLLWLDTVLVECIRLLKPNGSLYMFASPKMSARVEVLISERMKVLNRITWRKHDGTVNEGGLWSRANKEGLRAFFPQTESIIFAEHYGADNIAKGEAGYGAKCDELRGFVFEPLRAYICEEYKRAGMLNTEGKIATNVACGFSASSGGMASRHYFSQSQWCLPTEGHYQAMRELLNATGGEYLRREYEDLRREYEDLRRPFSVTTDVPYTDVWSFRTVAAYPGKHPCEKPLELLQHIIATSTRPGAVILDPFAGHGSLGEAVIRLGRSAILIEKDADYLAIAEARIQAKSKEKPE